MVLGRSRKQRPLSLFCRVFIPLLLLFDRLFIPLLLGVISCVVKCMQIECFLLKWLDGDLADAGAGGFACSRARIINLHFAFGRLNEPHGLLGCQRRE
jgi:hypothetical protein